MCLVCVCVVCCVLCVVCCVLCACACSRRGRGWADERTCGWCKELACGGQAGSCLRGCRCVYGVWGKRVWGAVVLFVVCVCSRARAACVRVRACACRVCGGCVCVCCAFVRLSTGVQLQRVCAAGVVALVGGWMGVGVWRWRWRWRWWVELAECGRLREMVPVWTVWCGVGEGMVCGGCGCGRGCAVGGACLCAVRDNSPLGTGVGRGRAR